MGKNSKSNYTIMRPIEFLARLLMAGNICSLKFQEEDLASIALILMLWVNQYKNRDEANEQKIIDKIFEIAELMKKDTSETREKMLIALGLRLN